ncbi:DMT family transporter [Falsiruegeria mediterranea]|uniref:EamA domain-containing protein n=1 Tax=Falsiruegeria mediterranea M17 TaxID=1200281 RepID=A0A2R8CA13_9RHOB|nr:DMT family transporter [Falsiruegeria mediterranea]SPJ29223.1 hypothetical protein TRM7615_02736 [Falsiruegeria mediterranea M17]
MIGGSGARRGHSPDWPSATPYLLLIIPPLLWGGNAVLGRHVVTEIPPLQLSFLRWLLSLAVLLPFTFRPLLRSGPDVRARWRSIALLSTLGVICFGTLFYVGLQTTTAINAGLWQTLVPVLILVLSRAFLGLRLRPIQIVAVCLSALGVLLVLSQGHMETLLEVDLLPGDLFVLTGVLCWALFSTLLMKDPLPLSPMVSLSMQILFALPVLFFLAFLEAQFTGPAQLSWKHLGYLIFLGPVVGAFAVSLWMLCVRAAGPPVAGLYLNLIPIFAAILGGVFLDEAVRWFHVVAMLAIGTGILLATAPHRPPGSRHSS